MLDGCHWLEFEPDASPEMAHAAAVTLSKLGNLFARESPPAGRRSRPEHELGPATPHVEHEFAREHVGGPAVRVLPCRRGSAWHGERQLDGRPRVIRPRFEGSVGLRDHGDEPGLALPTAAAGVGPEAIAELGCHHLCRNNQCVGCTRQFFTKSFLGDDSAVLARSSGEEPAPPCYRAGVASMAWRTTR